MSSKGTWATPELAVLGSGEEAQKITASFEFLIFGPPPEENGPS